MTIERLIKKYINIGTLILLIGIVLVILRFLFEPSIFYLFEIGISLIVLGVILYTSSNISNRLKNIEAQIELSKEETLSNISLKNNALYDEFLKKIKNKSYITRLSIYIPSLNNNSNKLVKDIILDKKIESKIRFLIGKDKSNKSKKQSFNELLFSINQKQKDFEIRKTDSQSEFTIIIIDTTVWVITNFLNDEEKGNLSFSISIYSDSGKPFVEYFNSLWKKSEKQI